MRQQELIYTLTTVCDFDVFQIKSSFLFLSPAARGSHQSGQRDEHLHHPQRVSGADRSSELCLRSGLKLLKFCAFMDSCTDLLFMSVWQTYIKSMDKDFVAATIQAIGRCATNIGEVRDTCLNGLVQLLSNRDGESLDYLHPLYSFTYLYYSHKIFFDGTRYKQTIRKLHSRQTRSRRIFIQ